MTRKEDIRRRYMRGLTAGMYIGGEHARCRLDDARTMRAWDCAEGAGLVRFRVEFDDGFNLGNLEFEQDKKTAMRDGVYGLIGEYRLTPDAAWKTGDSIWGIVGHDTAHCAPDIASQTLDALKAELRKRSRVTRDARMATAAPKMLQVLNDISKTLREYDAVLLIGEHKAGILRDIEEAIGATKARR